MDLSITKKTDFAEIQKKAEQVVNEIQDIRVKFPELSARETVDFFYSNQGNHVGIPKISITKNVKDLDRKIFQTKFWKRYIKESIKKSIESIYFQAGFIGKKGKSSSLEVQNMLRNEEKLAESLFNINMGRKNYQRYCQNMCFLKGFIEYATQNNLLCAFITITVPSKYHLKSKVKNLNSNLNPEEINQIIGERWKAICKKMSDKKIERLVCKVVEPHEDGTPHWHILIWHHEKNKNLIWRLFEQKFSDFIQERDSNLVWQNLGVDELKNQIKKMYYLLKTIEPSENNQHIIDYRKIWKIRSPEFSGILGVTGIWQECRKTNPSIDFDGPWMKKLQELAKSNNFCEFLTIIKTYPSLKKKFNKTSANLIQAWTDLA